MDENQNPELGLMEPNPVQLPDRLYFRIGEVSEILGVKSYVLRYWETEFPVLSPNKSSTGQRVYRKSDVETLLLIKHLLYVERYSIEGARNRIRELRREGDWDSFKKEKVYGGEKALLRKKRLQEMKALAQDILLLSKKPIHEFFKL